MRTRGIVLDAGSGKGAGTAVASKRAIDFEVLFEFDSARLTSDGRGVLDALGGALESAELANVRRVTLEGHTDAKGSDEYNESLSLLRAQAARQYLDPEAPDPVRPSCPPSARGRAELADRATRTAPPTGACASWSKGVLRRLDDPVFSRDHPGTRPQRRES